MWFLLSAPHGSSSTDDVVTLSEFQSLSEEAVRKMAAASMKKCALDPFPSSILLLCIKELLPVITRMLNVSLKHGSRLNSLVILRPCAKNKRTKKHKHENCYRALTGGRTVY